MFLQIELWFSVDRMPTPDDPSQPYQYNRMENLKRVLFDFFANHEETPSKLYYKEMVKDSFCTYFVLNIWAMVLYLTCIYGIFT